MIKKIEIPAAELEVLKDRSKFDTDLILEWGNVLQWSLLGYIQFNAPTCWMDGPGDLRDQIVRSVSAGVPLYQIPVHPADYHTTFGELYDSLAPTLQQEVLEQFRSWTPEQVAAHRAQQALQGLGWFGTIVPGYFGTIAGPSVRGVDRQMLEYYRDRGYADACFAETTEDADPVTSVQFARNPRGESRFAAIPPRDQVHVIAPREEYLWALEEHAAQDDCLSHLAIRALFIGVGKFMSSVSDSDLVYIANAHPVPSLAAHIRIWRHRDSRNYARHGQGLGLITASEALFGREGFLEECLELGKEIARAQGGLVLPDLMTGPPLTLAVGEVDAELHFPHVLAINSEIVDVIGVDAAQGAMAQAAQELGLYGITVHPVTF